MGSFKGIQMVFSAKLETLAFSLCIPLPQLKNFRVAAFSVCGCLLATLVSNRKQAEYWRRCLLDTRIAKCIVYAENQNGVLDIMPVEGACIWR
jgi:hypothetical protein